MLKVINQNFNMTVFFKTLDLKSSLVLNNGLYDIICVNLLKYLHHDINSFFNMKK